MKTFSLIFAFMEAILSVQNLGLLIEMMIIIISLFSYNFGVVFFVDTNVLRNNMSLHFFLVF